MDIKTYLSYLQTPQKLFYQTDYLVVQFLSHPPFFHQCEIQIFLGTIEWRNSHPQYHHKTLYPTNTPLWEHYPDL